MASVYEPLKQDGRAENRMIEPATALGNTEEAHGTTVVALDVGLSVRQKGGLKQILRNVSVSVKPGEMLAIMGPSGSGKTTFLNFLANRLGHHFHKSGKVYFNGQDDRLSYVRDFSSYVMQEDYFFEFLTVRETVTYAAKLRLNYMTRLQQTARVEWCLSELGLIPCQDVYVGGTMVKGCSGGQRKRVSIAIALLASPSVLFLDEPTSGLDASLSYDVMKTVANLAHNHGQTVICTIHQPRSQVFALFDSLLLLRLGEVVYRGPADKAVAWFAKIGHRCPGEFNPPDYFLDLLTAASQKPEAIPGSSPATRGPSLLAGVFPSGSFWSWDSIAQGSGILKRHSRETIARCEVAESEAALLASKFAESPLNQAQEEKMRLLAKIVEPIFLAESVRSSGWLSSLRTVLALTARDLKNARRQTSKFVVSIGQGAVMGLLTGTVWWQIGMPRANFSTSPVDCDQENLRNLMGAIFQILNLAGFSSFDVAVDTVKTRALFNREISSGLYVRPASFVARGLAYVVHAYWGIILYHTIIYFCIGLRHHWGTHFASLCCTIVVKFCANSVALLTGHLGPTIPVATALLPVIAVPLLVTSGFQIMDDQVPVGLVWIKSVSYIRYGLQSMTRLQLWRDPEEYANLCMGFRTPNNFWANVCLALASGMGFRFLAFIAAMTLHKRQGVQ